MKYYACTYPPIDFNLGLLLSEQELKNKMDDYKSDGYIDIGGLKKASKDLFDKLGCDVDLKHGGYFVIPNMKLLTDFEIYFFVKGDNNGISYICGKEKFPYGLDFISIETIIKKEGKQ